MSLFPPVSLRRVISRIGFCAWSEFLPLFIAGKASRKEYLARLSEVLASQSSSVQLCVGIPISECKREMMLDEWNDLARI